VRGFLGATVILTADGTLRILAAEIVLRATVPAARTAVVVRLASPVAGTADAPGRRHRMFAAQRAFLHAAGRVVFTADGASPTAAFAVAARPPIGRAFEAAFATVLLVGLQIHTLVLAAVPTFFTDLARDIDRGDAGVQEIPRGVGCDLSELVLPEAPYPSIRAQRDRVLAVVFPHHLYAGDLFPGPVESLGDQLQLGLEGTGVGTILCRDFRVFRIDPDGVDTARLHRHEGREMAEAEVVVVPGAEQPVSGIRVVRRVERRESRQFHALVVRLRHHSDQALLEALVRRSVHLGASVAQPVRIQRTARLRPEPGAVNGMNQHG
jgi:hypothetical protein